MGAQSWSGFGLLCAWTLRLVVLPAYPSFVFPPKFPGLEGRTCFFLESSKFVAEILSDRIHNVESVIGMQS